MQITMFMSTILDMRASIIVYPVIIILLVGIFAVEYSAFQKTDDEDGGGSFGNTDDYEELAFSEEPIYDYLEENTQKDFTFNEEGLMMTKMQATLAWVDEESQLPMVNRPDNFKIVITRPCGENTESDMVPLGALTIFTQTENATWEDGVWTVTVICGDCGDQQGVLRSEPDNGNEFMLSVTYYWLEDL